LNTANSELTTILWAFLSLRLVQHFAERLLAKLNHQYYCQPDRQRDACAILGISDQEMQRSASYSEDKYFFARLAGTISLAVTLTFLLLGGLGKVEAIATHLSQELGGGSVQTGLWFFATLALGSTLVGLPFDYYRTFVIEQKHGFNRQTHKGFWLDRVKGLALSVMLGLPIAALILWLMQASGMWWWLWAWAALSGFSVLTAWLYPTFLAPIFNKFSPVTDANLSQQIEGLAHRIGFRTGGILVMDASRRSSHGNAYFTGVFGKKRIVLFDTLLNALGTNEVVAVLAHELGHFKLNHVRWGLIRGVLATGIMFYILSLCLPMKQFYQAFGLDGVSNYGALVVFSLWFGLVDFVVQPLSNAVSRRNEFAADRFAIAQIGDGAVLATGLLKLRETSAGMPLSHPWYSAVYHSHPPILERLQAMGYNMAQVSKG
jgi:STE24 endopeptidase